MTDDYTVQLERVFHGPMDLLLHLVREQEVEIHEVEIHKVIEGYFEYLKSLADLELEVAGDFLVMAATLMAIKSRSLLPSEEIELEDELDSGDELIQRLVEYRRFKAAANDLDERRDARVQQATRGYEREVRDNEAERTFELGELTAWDLLAAFSRLMRETLAHRVVHVKGEARPLRWFVHQLGRAIHAHHSMELDALLLEIDETPTKESLIGAFCALLELMRLGVVTVEQPTLSEPIRIILRDDVEADFDSMIGASRFMDEEGLDEAAAEPAP